MMFRGNKEDIVAERKKQQEIYELKLDECKVEEAEIKRMRDDYETVRRKNLEIIDQYVELNAFNPLSLYVVERAQEIISDTDRGIENSLERISNKKKQIERQNEESEKRFIKECESSNNDGRLSK